ncbi:alcohol dehydrogenase GroES-like domain-containing protein [Colletotrichum graminicola]|uniref:Alcohol dehydrogenase GroES-like domain-containing protein n=1 Tax=Colletotrichum graminicola (strain M1.001 / M2 / FGSC 10212) TaxID=645133 RepID=E3QUN2_COLGM|nr:alcohol dehydrogenase GroES-like domain-containing protein [Colletotrichum graminicola M1.001]EFQ34570.1 alcohol dehydrogenase GroES-like domain-containing protein [Colletotrichum graminicola M1.001]WDK22651.1 alcohol dehydrogenase GroES-like domain-containing protein [Colletotrichum graminicola]
MSVRKALVGKGPGEYEIIHDGPIPDLQPDQMLCKTHSVALNPADAKTIDNSPCPGIGGYDFSGTVVKVGSSATRFKAGDDVFGFVHGLNSDNHDSGAFADHVVATADLCCRMPSSITSYQASTMALAFGTVGYAMFKQLGLAMPGTETGERPGYVLVAGGNTASGRMAIQLLKLSGIKPVVTCSVNVSAIMKDLGAAETFDYRSSTCGREIKNFTRNKLAHALDCVTSADTMASCFEAIGAKGGKYIGLEAPPTLVKYSRRDVTVDWVQALSLFGKPVKLDGVYGRPASQSDRQFAAQLYRAAERWTQEGLVRGPEFQLREGGLEGITEGIDQVRKGKVRGFKLVYPIA